MKSFNLIISFSILIIFASCSSQTEKQEKVVEQVEKIEVIEAKVEIDTLPSLSFDEVNSLISQANSLEASFYYSGKSVTLWDSNVKGVLAMMVNPPPARLKTKNLVGHIMVMKKDEKAADVLAYIELFMDGPDSFAMFKIDEKKYYHSLSEKGLEFFTQMTTAPTFEK